MTLDNQQPPSRRSVLKSAVALGAGATLPHWFGCSGVRWARGRSSLGDNEAAAFLADYASELQRLYTDLNEAQWIASTDVSDEHTQAAIEARNRFDEFVGAPDRMDAIASFRERAWAQAPVTNRQCDRAWLMAAEAPGTLPELVRQRAAAEARQSQTQDGFTFRLQLQGQPSRPVTANDIDEILRTSDDLDERSAAWSASKEIGVKLKPGLVELQRLRNATARELDFSSYFGLKVASYGMTVGEMVDLMQTVLAQTRPLYEQLHCYAKHRLAARFGQPVPRRIPAHWLPNRWGQEWPGLEESVNLDPIFAERSPDWIVQQAERFYVSMGFPKLPAGFWEKSDLYALPAGATRKKNSHASAWHIDLNRDVRSLMSVKPDAYWFNTTHHELGHIYYYLAYSRPEVPLLLREGANRAFHEGIGDLIGLASSQLPYLSEIGLLRGGDRIDTTRWLLSEAMGGNVVFLRFACGTMTGFEHDLYEIDLSPGEYNARWWQLAREYQGIEPTEPRGEQFCDAASKTHINDDAAEYYDYAIGTLIVYQVHDYIARKILNEDPRSCNYYNRKDVGEYLSALLSLGATRDWRHVLRDFTGEDLSARAMMEYFAPLMDFLKRENAGRDVSFA
jgi:peptidyl-dipeptidase A